MTHADIRTRVIQRLDADPTDATWKTYATAAINEGLRLFSFLTLCLETSGTLTFTPGTATYHALATFSDWLLPLRVSISGAKVKPATAYEMAALDEAWLNAPGVPRRYGCQGWDLLFFDRKPTGGAATIVYAKSAAALSGDSDVPAIPDADHEALISYGAGRLLANAGGQMLTGATELIKSYLDAAKQRADQVRARSLSRQYDRVPAELAGFDYSKILRPDLARKENRWTGQA